VNDGDGVQRRRLTRTEAKARTRQQLLDAAARTFAQKGYGGASVEEIAESAGYSTGALFLELMSARASRRITAVAEILEGEDAGDPIEALARLMERTADRNQDTDLMALRAEFWLYAVRNPDAMEALVAQRRDQVDGLTGVISTAMERWGAPADVSATELATVVLAMFQGLVRQRRIDPARVSGDLFAQSLRWLFAGLGATGPEPPERAR
jgi:AcrR family transcriptional regulator